jgi:hypothetical protein
LKTCKGLKKIYPIDWKLGRIITWGIRASLQGIPLPEKWNETPKPDIFYDSIWYDRTHVSRQKGPCHERIIEEIFGCNIR